MTTIAKTPRPPEPLDQSNSWWWKRTHPLGPVATATPAPAKQPKAAKPKEK